MTSCISPGQCLFYRQNTMSTSRVDVVFKNWINSEKSWWKLKIYSNKQLFFNKHFKKATPYVIEPDLSALLLHCLKFKFLEIKLRDSWKASQQGVRHEFLTIKYRLTIKYSFFDAVSDYYPPCEKILYLGSPGALFLQNNQQSESKYSVP